MELGKKTLEIISATVACWKVKHELTLPLRRQDKLPSTTAFAVCTTNSPRLMTHLKIDDSASQVTHQH